MSLITNESPMERERPGRAWEQRHGARRLPMPACAVPPPALTLSQPALTLLPQALALVLPVLALFILVGCDLAGASHQHAPTYRVTDGACGEIVFEEHLAADFDSAIQLIEAQKVEQYGRENVSLEVHELGVVDSNGETPGAEFYAVHVLSAESGTHLHSVSEVVSSNGDLFRLMWCPD